MNGITQLFCYITLVFLSFFSSLAPALASEWTGASKDGRVFTFTKAGTTENLTLTLPTHDAELVDLIDLPGIPTPYVLVRGASCEKCPSNPKVLFLQNLKTGSKLHTFVHPGKVTDTKTGSMLFDGRAFYGKCVAGGKTNYVSFQREHIGKRKGYRNSVFVADLESNGTISERLVEGRRAPSMKYTLAQLKNKHCTEIARLNRSTMRKAFDLGPDRVGIVVDEDEEKAEEERIKAKEPVVPEAAPEIPATKPEEESN